MSSPQVPNREPLSPERLDAINRLTTVARLLSSAVHDTRNALQIVTGHAELFAETSANVEKARERARAILAQSDRATQRMQGLVVMAQEADGPSTRFDLQALADDVVALRKSSFGRARIRATITPSTGQLWVVAPRADVLRVAANLMLNAERAVTGRPDAEIRFTVARVGGQVRLSVKDNGPGVAEDVLPTLFEPFAESAGPGVGLHVSRWLMQRAGGTLALVSNEGGAEFALELPAAS